MVLSIVADDYLKMAPDLSIMIYINAHVLETGQAFAAMEPIEFVKPNLLSEVSILAFVE